MKKEDWYKRHRRYRTVSLKFCNSDCPKGGEPLEIILFVMDGSLRKHVVKHIIKDGMKKFMKSIESIDIMNIKKELQHLGCPGLTMADPPCDNKKGCRYDNVCKKIVKGLETKYLEIVQETIKNGGNIPRYACYFHNDTPALWVLSDEILAVNAYYLKGSSNIYNLASCHSRNGTLEESRDYLRRKIELSNCQNSPIWCTPEKWGVFLNQPFRNLLKGLKKEKVI